MKVSDEIRVLQKEIHQLGHYSNKNPEIASGLARSLLFIGAVAALMLCMVIIETFTTQSFLSLPSLNLGWIDFMIPFARLLQPPHALVVALVVVLWLITFTSGWLVAKAHKQENHQEN